MVSVKKKQIGKQKYYYLEYSFRDGKKVLTKEKYLGKELPKNVEELKRDFLEKIQKDKWEPLLGKIKKNYSKESRTIPQEIKKKNLKSFAVRFTYDSQRIEGSTLTLRETSNLLEKGIAPRKSLEDIKEAESHEKVFYDMFECKKKLSLSLVLYWNKLLLGQTKQEIAGQIRKHQVLISGSKFVPPLPVEVDLLLREFFKWYNKNKEKVHPVELAALTHLKFVTIHPFGDGNGRISRIMMNFVLHNYKFPLYDVAYENRSSYYHALERSQVKKDDSIFVQWFLKRYVKEYKRYL